MTPSSPHLSAFAIDALLEGALSADDEARAHAHLAGCAACRRALDDGRAARQQFRARVLPRTEAAIAARAGAWRWRPLWIAAPALAAAIALVLVVVSRPGAPGDLPGVAIKGQPALQVFAQHDGRVFQVADGAPLAPGDQIRFVAAPGELGYLLIASVDAAGQVTIYHPYGGDESAPIAAAAGPSQELPGSIVLDATLGPERIYALFSRRPIAAAEVRARLAAVAAGGAARIRDAGPLDIAADAQLSLRIEKTAR